MSLTNWYKHGSVAHAATKDANGALSIVEDAVNDVEHCFDDILGQLDDLSDQLDTAVDERREAEKQLEALQNLTYNDTLLSALVRIKLEIEAVLENFKENGVDVDSIESAARSDRDSRDGSSQSVDIPSVGETPAAGIAT